MKVAINSLVIDEKKTGVGNYAYNLVSTLLQQDVNIGYNIDVFAQKNFWQKNQKQNLNQNINIKVSKSLKSNYCRILYEQLILPIKYIYGQYDIIHLLDYQSPFLHLNKNYIISIHDLSFFLFTNTFSKGQRIYKQVNTNYGLKNAKGIITISKSTKEDILTIFPYIDERKIEIIPLAVNSIFKRKIYEDEIIETKQRFNINGEYILFVGTLEPRKNIFTIINSFRKILYYYPNIKLVIVGKKGWLYQEILKKVRNERLQGNVIFTDYVKDEYLPALYKGAKAFLFPSLYEGFGIPVLEAMTVGCPVITSNLSSLPEVAGNAGILINPLDEEEIADSILILLNNEDKRKELIINGKKRAESFSWEKTAEKTIKVYEKIGREIR